jgi:hypothetical protein
MGYYHESFLVECLESEIGNLLAGFAGLDSELSALRWRPSQLIGAFDNAITNARNSLYEKEYKEAVRQVKQARRALTGLQKSKDANAAYESANSAYKKARELAGFLPVGQLITFKYMARLLSESDRLLRAGEYRQARLLAHMCIKKTTELQSRDNEVQKGESLLARINRMEEVASRAGEFTSDEQRQRFGVRAIEGLRSLIVDHRLKLVEALVDDLESEFASRKAFLSIYEQHIKRSPESAAPAASLILELRQIIAASSWDAASQYILRRTLGKDSSQMQSLHSRLIKASAALSEMLSAGQNES